MDLHEEYYSRKKLACPLVKHVERATMILKATDKDCEWGWLHISISFTGDGQHPGQYQFVVSANPVIYSTPDFNHFSHHSKVLSEQRWEWDQYEPELLKWAQAQKGKYRAIDSQDAVFVAWEMFVSNYDAWMANFLTFRIQEKIFQTLKGQRAVRLGAMKETEEYIRERYERVYICWKNIKGAIEQKNYADWLAKVVNDMQRDTDVGRDV